MWWCGATRRFSYQSFLCISFDFDFSCSISGRGGGETISWWGKKNEIEELRMMTASSSQHYIVTRHSDRSTYTYVCVSPVPHSDPFRLLGCWIESFIPPPPFFHFIFFFFFSMGVGQPNDGVRQNFLYGCVVTENTRGLPHWSSKGFRSRVALIQPVKINSFVVMVVGWGDFKRIKSFSTFDLFVMMGVE